MIETNILEVFSRSGMSRTDFAARLGISNAVLSHIASGRNKASLDLVVAILNQFPDINPDWLLLGRGEMKRGGKNLEEFRSKIQTYIGNIRSTTARTNEQLQLIESEITELK